MSELLFESEQYRLRAATPMPVKGGHFKLHTFMGEISKVVNYMCTERLPGSNEFRGQGGDLMSASFSRLAIEDGKIFSGKKVYSPEYVNERD